MNNICSDGFCSNLYAGDNFRSVSRQPTEQDSFSLLNLVDLVGSPYGQFLNGLWKGKESRANLQAHLKGTYKELDSAVRQGVKIKLKYVMSAFFELLTLHLKLPPPKKKKTAQPSGFIFWQRCDVPFQNTNLRYMCIPEQLNCLPQPEHT